jgi:hypothetical protein
MRCLTLQSTVPPYLESIDAPQTEVQSTRPRVLFANHNGRSAAEGVAARVLAETVAGLRDLNVVVAVASEPCPDVTSHVSVCSLHEIGMLSHVAPSVRTPFTVVPHGVDSAAFGSASETSPTVTR